MKPVCSDDLIQKIRIAPDEASTEKLLEELAPGKLDKPARVAFVNAHAMNLCAGNQGFLSDLLQCEYVLRDGSGMKILYKMLGREPGLNLNGTDLIPQILSLYKGRKVALLGTQSPYLERAGEAIGAMGADVVLSADGFQDDDFYVRAAAGTPAELIILAMGMPKQERVARLLAETLTYPALIVCGGAILDFMGGKVSRAPEFLRKTGMEWLYRLALEPRRLFGRYVIGNAVFLIRAARMALRG